MVSVKEALAQVATATDYEVMTFLQVLMENASTLPKHAGAIEGVVQCIRSNKSDGSIVSQAITILNEVASSKRSHQLIVAKNGGLQIILLMLNSLSKDREVAEESCAALRSITACTETRVLFVNAGGVDILLQTMQFHWGVKGVVENGCYILWGLSAAEEAQRLVCNAGAIDTLIRAVEDWDRFAFILEYCCGALRNLATSNDELRSKVVNSGGVLAPLTALKQHPTNPRVTEQALALLVTLAGTEGQSADHLKTVAVPYVLPALRKNQFSPGVMEQGCTVLWCIAAVAAQELVDGGVLAVLLQALQAHQRAPRVIAKACGALTNLCAVQSCRSYLCMVSELHELLLESLETHIDDPEVVLQSLRCLSNLALEDFLKLEIGRLKGVGWVVDVLRSHVSRHSVAEQCCVLIARLAVLEQNEALIIRAQGVEALVDALRAHAADSRMVEVVTIALRNLVANEESSIRMGDPHAVSAIANALHQQRENSDASQHTCAILRYMAVSNDHARAHMVSCGVKNDCEHLLEKFSQESEIGQEAKALIDYLFVM